MKATTRKLLYPVLLVSLLGVAIGSLWAGIRPIYLLLFALVLLAAARLANYQLRDFYRGLQASQQQDWPTAETNFQAFLARGPWLKRLM